VKFLCLDCDEPMKLHGTQGPDEGSLTVTFRCPECGFRVAMLTNPFETQMVRSLGVKIGGRPAPAGPFEHLRASMANPRADAFEGAAGSGEGAGACPFAAMLNEAAGTAPGSPAAGSGPVAAAPAVTWTPGAEARLARIPDFIRPMARKAIERYAESQGHASITEAVMDDARSTFGM
jgi:hypothetical protein